MSYQASKDGTIVISGFEQGIAPSPHKGIGNIQCANLSTETGELMCNYIRSQVSQPSIVSGTFVGANSSFVVYSGTPALQVGAAVNIGAGITGLNAGIYWVVGVTGGNEISLSTTNPQNTTNVTGLGTSGSAAFFTIDMTLPVQGASELYLNSSNIQQQRYYILTQNSYVWCYDTGLTLFGVSPGWFLIDSTVNAANNNAGGIGIYNGFLHEFVEQTIYTKLTSNLAQAWGTMTQGLNTSIGSPNSHYAFPFNGRLFYCDSNFVGAILATSNTGVPLNPNIFGQGVYTFATTTLSISYLVSGDLPLVGSTIVFRTTGTLPTGVSANTVYYIKSIARNTNPITITISASVGGSAVSLSGGSGTQFFSTYDPGVAATYTLSTAALLLGSTEVTQALAQTSNSLIVGTKSNQLYIWDTIGSLPNSFIPLPENNTAKLLTVNNMVYSFSGSKGNIYITNGSTSSAVLTVPDYVTAQIEPYYTWGDVMYVRGRVWFSIQDSNSKVGGVWSFIPTQNLFIGQDTGIALRLEHQNSYGTYAGKADVLIAAFNQAARGVQYWSGWDNGSSISGIDGSGTVPYTGGQTIIESDIVPVGAYSDPQNYTGIEFRLSAPLVSGESIQILMRNNITSAYTTCGTFSTVGGLMFRFKIPIPNVYWVQIKAVLTSTASNPSFVRLKELRIYKVT